MDPAKLKGIHEWLTPQKVKHVRQYLGFTGYYQRFIQGYSNLAKPLNNLLQKNKPWHWGEEEQKAFDTLKQRFQEKPVLRIPDDSEQFIIETDASKWASGGVLRQKDENGDKHPCSFISNGFNQAEQNYEIYDWELLAIVQALETWQHYLHGSPHPIIIRSDHKNLQYFQTAQKLNRRQARWSLFLSEFEIQLIHIPGSQMIQSDALSRRPDHVPEEDTDNKDRVLLPDNLFINLIDLDLNEQLKKALKDNRGLEEKMRDKENWEERDGLWFHQDKCYIPENCDLRRAIV